MKKIFGLLAMAALCGFGLTACGGNPMLSEMAGGAEPAGKGESLVDVLGYAAVAGTTLTSPDKNNNINGFVANKVFSFPTLNYYDWMDGDTEIQISGDTLVIDTDYPPYRQTLKAEDFTLFSNGLAGIILDENGESYDEDDLGVPDSWLSVRETSAVILGGTSVPLEHTSFGLWEYRVEAYGSGAGEIIDGVYNLTAPFILETTRAEKLAPAANAYFTGVVLATASQTGADNLTGEAESLVGKIELEVSRPTRGHAKISFDNFHTLSSALYITKYGHIASKGHVAVSDAAKNTTGIILFNGGYGGLEGQFYGGPKDLAATEAVGGFSYTSGRSSVTGSFGVTANP